jgi:hypothetical protein
MYGNDTPLDPGHEVWVQLGKAARCLYYRLNVAPSSARQLAKQAGTSPMTACRQLKVLASYRLARKTDDGWVIGDRMPDDVVTDMGWVETNSKTGRRAAQAEDERSGWRAYCEVKGWHLAA